MTRVKISVNDELSGISVENSTGWQINDGDDYGRVAEHAALEWSCWEVEAGSALFVRIWDADNKVLWDGRVEFRLCPKAVETPCQS